MNTKTYTPLRFSRHFIFTVISISVLLTALPEAQAQLPNKPASEVQSDFSTPSLQELGMTRFTVRAVEGVVYLNWYMKGETDNSIFLVERAVNGGEYIAIGFKDGYASPDTKTELLYCYSDHQPIVGTSIYRIKQFKKEVMLYGKPLSVVVTENIQTSESTR